jgi:transcriptional regulator with XRE-family HTH domain
MKTIDKILKLLKDNNMNEQDICRMLNTHKSKMYDWKTGRSRPTAEEIAIIAKFFGVSSDYLLGVDTPVKAHNVVINPYGGTRRELNLTDEQYKAIDALLDDLLKKPDNH